MESFNTYQGCHYIIARGYKSQFFSIIVQAATDPRNLCYCHINETYFLPIIAALDQPSAPAGSTCSTEPLTK